MSVGSDRIFEEMERICSECGNELAEAELDGTNMCCACLERVFDGEVHEAREEANRQVALFEAELRRRERENENRRTAQDEVDAGMDSLHRHVQEEVQRELSQGGRRQLERDLDLLKARKELMEKVTRFPHPKKMFRKLRIPQNEEDR